MFIVLNTFGSYSYKVRINVMFIKEYYSNSSGSSVVLSDDGERYFHVKETPDDIDKMLAESYITVKK